MNKQEASIQKLTKMGFRIDLNGSYGTHMSIRKRGSSLMATVEQDGSINGMDPSDYIEYITPELKAMKS